MDTVDTVRVVTLNLWGEQPPLAERLARVIEECRLLQPDVLCLQEVRQVPGQVENTAATIAAGLGHSHVFAVATPWGGGDEGLAICPRFPLGRRQDAELPHATENE